MVNLHLRKLAQIFHSRTVDILLLGENEWITMD